MHVSENTTSKLPQRTSVIKRINFDNYAHIELFMQKCAVIAISEPRAHMHGLFADSHMPSATSSLLALQSSSINTLLATLIFIIQLRDVIYVS